jgi:hypothetical protein
MDHLILRFPPVATAILLGAGWQALARCAAVSVAWRDLAQADATWAEACQQLWRTKVFVCGAARRWLAVGRGRAAFQVAMEDVARVAITPAEVTSLRWQQVTPLAGAPTAVFTVFAVAQRAFLRQCGGLPLSPSACACPCPSAG